MRILRLVFAAKAAILRTVPLLREARVPISLKLVVAALGILIVSPVDIFGDIPVLGVLDDATLLALLCMWFVSQATRHLEPVRVRRHTGSLLAIR